jgi:hypothetical protein
VRIGLVGGVFGVLLAMASGCTQTDRDRHGASTPGRFTTPRPSGSGWNYDYLSATTGRRLSDVIATGPSDAWAAGTDPGGPLLMHFDGHGWQDHPLPETAPGLTITSLAASAPDNVWVFAEKPMKKRTYAWRWDGSRWREARIDTSYGVGDSAVLAPDDVWLVGSDDSLHWDGHRWREVPMPARATAISAVTAKDIWAVGRVATRGRQRTQPAAMHWDGRTWRLSPTPTFYFPEPVPPEATADLRDVLAVSPNDAWAIGIHTFNHGEGGEDPPDPPSIFLHWDGSRWTKQPIVPLCEFCQKLAADGSGRPILTSGSASVRAPDGRFTKLTGPPKFTGLRGKTKLSLNDVTNVPGTTRLWGVGVIEHNEAGNPWSRAAIVHYG